MSMLIFFFFIDVIKIDKLSSNGIYLKVGRVVKILIISIVLYKFCVLNLYSVLVGEVFFLNIV